MDVSFAFFAGGLVLSLLMAAFLVAMSINIIILMYLPGASNDVTAPRLILGVCPTVSTLVAVAAFYLTAEGKAPASMGWLVWGVTFVVPVIIHFREVRKSQPAK